MTPALGSLAVLPGADALRRVPLGALGLFFWALQNDAGKISLTDPVVAEIAPQSIARNGSVSPRWRVTVLYYPPLDDLCA